MPLTAEQVAAGRAWHKWLHRQKALGSFPQERISHAVAILKLSGCAYEADGVAGPAAFANFAFHRAGLADLAGARPDDATGIGIRKAAAVRALLAGHGHDGLQFDDAVRLVEAVWHVPAAPTSSSLADGAAHAEPPPGGATAVSLPMAVPAPVAVGSKRAAADAFPAQPETPLGGAAPAVASTIEPSLDGTATAAPKPAAAARAAPASGCAACADLQGAGVKFEPHYAVADRLPPISELTSLRALCGHLVLVCPTCYRDREALVKKNTNNWCQLVARYDRRNRLVALLLRRYDAGAAAAKANAAALLQAAEAQHLRAVRNRTEHTVQGDKSRWQIEESRTGEVKRAFDALEDEQRRWQARPSLPRRPRTGARRAAACSP